MNLPLSLANVLMIIDAHSNTILNIEQALGSWTFSDFKFAESTSASLVAYDDDYQIVIIFGGDKSKCIAPELTHCICCENQNKLYIYNIVSDSLYTVKITWNHHPLSKANLFNYVSTNAVIINKTLYAASYNHLFTLNLTDIYFQYFNVMASKHDEYEIIIQNNSADSIKILNSCNDNDICTYYAGEGCLNTDDTKNFLILSSSNKGYILVYDILNNIHWIAAQFNHTYTYNHGACVIMNDILYIVGGTHSNTIEYVEMELLTDYDQRNSYLSQFKDISTDNMYYNHVWWTQFGVIKDEPNGLIYILGGINHEREVHRINVSDQTITKLNGTLLPLPGIEGGTTIRSKTNGMIYIFRGLGGGDANKIAFTQIQHEPEIKITKNDNITNTVSPEINHSLLSSKLEIMIGIVLIGLICICCTIFIGLYATQRIKIKQAIDSSHETLMEPKQMKVDNKLNHVDNILSDSEVEKDSDDQVIKDTKIFTSLSDDKLQELNQLYLESRVECINKCKEFGFKDKFTDKLLDMFERLKSIQSLTLHSVSNNV